MPKGPKGKAKDGNQTEANMLSKKMKRKLKREHMQSTGKNKVKANSQRETTERRDVPVSTTVKPAKMRERKSKSGHEVCPDGHPLHLFRTPHDEYVCDACDSDFLPQRTVMFGCRLCDWDACEECVSDIVKERELKIEDSASKMPKGKAKVSKEGRWRMLRGADKYKNEYMYLRHDGSGVCVELPHYSLAQFEFRAGAGARGQCCSADGAVEPFQLTLPHLEEKLAAGGGKEVPEKTSILGNWELVGLGDGSLVAYNTCQFVKTTKHKEGEVDAPEEPTPGLELHFTPEGVVVRVAEEGQDDKAVVIEAHAPARTTTREEAMKEIGVSEGDEDEEED